MRHALYSSLNIEMIYDKILYYLLIHIIDPSNKREISYRGSNHMRHV